MKPVPATQPDVLARIGPDEPPGARRIACPGEIGAYGLEEPGIFLGVTQPVDVSPVPETGASITLNVPANMTVKGVSRDVTAKVDVKRAGDNIIAVASVPVTWTDFNVPPPDLGFVKVEPTGTIEFLVNLAKQ